MRAQASPDDRDFTLSCNAGASEPDKWVKSLSYRLGAYGCLGFHFEREGVVETTIKEVGQHLKQQATLGTPITYTDVIRRFPDLPMLTGAWRAHPLCGIFGELDDEDNVRKRPFRTALVFAKETGRPGQGFFDTVQNLRGTTHNEERAG
jgi:hypothetical protein